MWGWQRQHLNQHIYIYNIRETETDLGERTKIISHFVGDVNFPFRKKEKGNAFEQLCWKRIQQLAFFLLLLSFFFSKSFYISAFYLMHIHIPMYVYISRERERERKWRREREREVFSREEEYDEMLWPLHARSLSFALCVCVSLSSHRNPLGMNHQIYRFSCLSA